MQYLDQVKMNSLKIPDYTASERQTVFHTTVADEKLYGGAAGGGKTAAIVAEAITLALEYPGIPINLFRRTIPELKATIIPEIHKQAGEYMRAGHLTYHGQDRKFVFSNGSSIILNYLDTDNDIYRYQGAEMPVIGVDELTQFPQAWIEYLLTRNRTSNADWPVQFIAGTNPGGIGHGWVKGRYIDPVPPEQINKISLEDGEHVTRVFIPAKVDDHPDERFRTDYKRKLAGISDPQLRRALKDGDWDVFAGQVFKEFRRDVHVVDPFSIPAHWQRWRAMDYGNNNSVFWLTQDPHSERIYVYREYRTTEFVGVSEKAKMIKQFEAGESISYGMADPSIWNGQGNHNTGKPVAQMFSDEGVQWMPANNDRKAGLAVVHDRLAIKKDGLPGIQFFSTCTSLIRTLPSLPYDKIKVDDVDTKADDHDYDALRYGLMAFVQPEEEDDDYSTGNISKLFY
jgi:phage terminase large subunit